MGLCIFNTRTRQIEPFVPLDPAGKRVGMYCCGPTVHDFAHIGNWRTFVFADIVRRYLEFLGYQVTHVMNITDVEDKIIRKVRETGLGLREYTARFEHAFFEDFEALNCKRPHHTPRATEHIPDIIALVEALMARGIAYRAADGSVYFSIDRYRALGGKYGQLVNLDFSNMRQEARTRADEYAKESVADFALWKARDAEDGNVFWSSPWGEGRPGWHIECSVMSTKWLGPSFDLHLGGEDLIFPHHENEIAQAEGARLAGSRTPETPFVKYWLHGAHLMVEGRKMSKSLGNFLTLRDLMARGYTGREVRFVLLGAHYREPLNFTFDGLAAAKHALARIDEAVNRLRDALGPGTTALPEHPDSDPGRSLLERFTKAMNDNLNISAAWAAVFDWVREVNRLGDAGQLLPNRAADALVAWHQVNSVLGLGQPESQTVPLEVTALVTERENARKARDFQRADALRAQLKAMGWLVEDTPKGPRLKKL